MGRLKTGTPARLDGTTINTDVLEAQPADADPVPFSFLTQKIETPQTVCHITGTTAETFAIIAENIEKSPVYSGQISGVGPRYCPSIEDKVARFPTACAIRFFWSRRPRRYHRLSQWHFDIAAGGCAGRIYPHHSGAGAGAHSRHGYAIEYDYVDPRACTQASKPRPWRVFSGRTN